MMRLSNIPIFAQHQKFSQERLDQLRAGIAQNPDIQQIEQTQDVLCLCDRFLWSS